MVDEPTRLTPRPILFGLPAIFALLVGAIVGEAIGWVFIYLGTFVGVALLAVMASYSSQIERGARWLEECGSMRLLRSLAPIGIVTALILFYLDVEDRERDRIARNWQVIAASPNAAGGNIGQKDAVEFLNSKGIELEQVNLSWTLLRYADLPHANLARANLINAVIEHANLSNANLWRARLSVAIMSGANLRNADLQGAVLRRVQLDNADLTGANLTGADLTGANLVGAKVSRQQLSLACANPVSPPRVDDAVRPPPPWPQPCPPWTN